MATGESGRKEKEGGEEESGRGRVASWLLGNGRPWL